MKRQTLIHTLIYGLCGGILIVLLKLIEFRFLVVEHSIEIYGGLVAAMFAGLGIWLGLKLTKKKEVVVIKEVPVPAAIAAFHLKRGATERSRHHAARAGNSRADRAGPQQPRDCRQTLRQ